MSARTRRAQKSTLHAPVAQLDRVADSDSEGRRFNSCRECQNPSFDGFLRTTGVNINDLRPKNARRVLALCFWVNSCRECQTPPLDGFLRTTGVYDLTRRLLLVSRARARTINICACANVSKQSGGHKMLWGGEKHKIFLKNFSKSAEFCFTN